MTNPKIRPIPLILLKLEEQAISDWLVNLSKNDNTEACLQILFLLQLINETSTVKKRFSILKLIDNFLIDYIRTIKVTFWDASIPFSKEETSYAETTSWLYSMLGLGFFKAAKETGFKYYSSSSEKAEEETFSLCKALQLMGQAQLHALAIYCDPGSGFWQLVYQIYSYAEKKKLLDMRIQTAELENTNINTCFKQIIIFSICNTNQFRPRDMRIIFNFLAKVCDLFTIDTKPEYRHNNFIINLVSDNPPTINDKELIASSSLRYFSSSMLAHHIKMSIKENNAWSGLSKFINAMSLKRVIRTLEHNQDRRYKRSASKIKVKGMVGFENIVNYLRLNLPAPVEVIPEVSAKHKKLELFKHDDILWNMTNTPDDFNIAFKQALEYSNKEESHHELSQEIKPVDIIDIDIINTSAKGYSIYLNDSHLKAKVNDILGMILGNDDKKRMEISLIRRIQRASINNFQFGVEVICFDAEVVYISNAEHLDKNGCWAILIFGEKILKRPDMLLYPTRSFNPGDKILLYKENKEFHYIIVKEINCTTSISQVEIEYLGAYSVN